MRVLVLCECSLCLLYYMAHHCVWFALREANSLWYVRTPFWSEADSVCVVSYNFLSGTNLASVQLNLLLFEQGVGGLKALYWSNGNHTLICCQEEINSQCAALMRPMMNWITVAELCKCFNGWVPGVWCPAWVCKIHMVHCRTAQLIAIMAGYHSLTVLIYDQYLTMIATWTIPQCLSYISHYHKLYSKDDGHACHKMLCSLKDCCSWMCLKWYELRRKS